jgi:formimidoylglutamate deiminase
MTLPAESRSLFSTRALLPEGWAEGVRVEIANGRIGKLERDTVPMPGDEIVDVLLPGMANVHSHGFQRGMAGHTEYRGPEADNFWSWRELMYRFVARMTPEDVEAITAMAYVEMLEGGFTRVGEFHYVHHDENGAPYADPAEMCVRIAAAAQGTGIALTLLPVFYAHADFGGAAPSEGQRRFVSTVDQYAQLVEACRRLAASLPDGAAGVAPHSLRAVTPAELKMVAALARTGPIQIHAAEQLREVEACVAWSGARPVQWLLEHADLNPRWCLVHATHMTEVEIAGLARSRAVAGFCPVTEANLGDGISPAAPFLAAGGAFGIGTDSNVSIGVRDELRLLEYSQRLRDRSRNVLAASSAHSTGRTLFEQAQRGGAQALGMNGGLAPGFAADLFSLAAEGAVPAASNCDALLDRFIFSASNVQHVWRSGRKVVSQGVHHERQAVHARYLSRLQRLIS